MFEMGFLAGSVFGVFLGVLGTRGFYKEVEKGLKELSKSVKAEEERIKNAL